MVGVVIVLRGVVRAQSKVELGQVVGRCGYQGPTRDGGRERGSHIKSNYAAEQTERIERVGAWNSLKVT